MAPSNARRERRKARSAARTAKKKNQKGASTSNAPATDGVEELLSKARTCEENGKLEEAVKIFEKALLLKPNDADLCEEAAALCMQAGDPEKAVKMFKTAVGIAPGSGFEKYAYLGQLLGNTEEALVMAQQGIKIIKGEATSLNSNDQERLEELRGYEASAHCAVAEICLGLIEDSNDPNVAQRMDPEVEKAVMEALSLGEEGSDSEIEAMLSLANLRLSQGRREEALESMKRILLRMSNGLEILETGDTSDASVLKGLGALPPLEIRIAVGKQLIEVEMWRAAIATLNSVMWECDFNVEVWYLLAVAYWKLGDFSEARNALKSTSAALNSPDGFDGHLEEEMIKKLYKELNQKSDPGDETQDRMQD